MNLILDPCIGATHNFSIKVTSVVLWNSPPVGFFSSPWCRKIHGGAIWWNEKLIKHWLRQKYFFPVAHPGADLAKLRSSIYKFVQYKWWFMFHKWRIGDWISPILTHCLVDYSGIEIYDPRLGIQLGKEDRFGVIEYFFFFFLNITLFPHYIFLKWNYR